MNAAAWLLVLIAQISAGAVQPAGSQLYGIVRTTTSTPIGGVELTLTGPSGARTATTDAAGEFRFSGLPTGLYELAAHKAGLIDVSTRVDLATGVSVPIDIELQPVFVETTVVTAGRASESLLSVPAAVSVIDRRTIDALPANTLPDLFRDVPGVNITQLSARDIEITTRDATGILSNSMLAMVDGRSIVQPFYGAVYWDLVTLGRDEIDQIEVLRSPASALWGASALNGVINIRTRAPREIGGLRLEATWGQRGTRQANVIWADATPALSYKISGSYFEQDAWDRDNLLPSGAPMPPAAIFENRGTRQPKMDARIDWDGNAHRLWSLRGGVGGTSGLTHSGLGPGEFAAGSYYDYLELDHVRGSFEFKSYWNRLHSPYRIVLFGLDEQATSDTFVGEATKRLALGRLQNLTFGGSVKVDRFDVSIAPADHRRTDAGAFVEDRVALGSHLTLVAGGRVDKFDTTAAVFSPRLGAVVTPVPGHSIRGTYNRAARAPSLLENFVNVTLPAAVPLDPPFYYTQLVLGSTALQMEKQDAFEVGYTGTIGSNAAVFVTAYDQRVTNKIWFLPVSFYGPGAPPPGWPSADPATVPFLPHVFSFINLGSVRNRGVELAATYSVARLSLQGNYTFKADPEQGGSSLIPLTLNRPARHQFGGSLIASAARWTGSASAHYTDSAFWADVLTEPFWGETPSFVDVNGGIAYRIPKRPWEFRLDATNLFDQKIKSHAYGDIVRRKVTAGVRWRWDKRLPPQASRRTASPAASRGTIAPRHD